MNHIFDVIVVGCGAAGVAAIRRFHDAGVNVLGLEAADRIGGRIHTIEHGANHVDLGATWCLEKKGNVIYEMAHQLGVLDKSKPHENWYMLSNGESVSDAVGESIMAAIEQEVDGADENTVCSASECVWKAANFNETLKKNATLTKSFIEFYERDNHLCIPNDPRKTRSLKGFKEHRAFDGEFLNWEGRGYKTALELMLKQFPDPSKAITVQILLNKEVESIKWGISNSDDSNAVEVKCKDGNVYHAKSVIVTIGVGVLKERHTQLFDPILPADKVNTINGLQLCVLGKIYIEFTDPWWPCTPASFAILWRDEDKAKFTEDEKWITEIYAFDTVPHQPNLLLACLQGPRVQQMENASLDVLQNGLNKLIDMMFRKQFHVTPIVTIMRSQWASDPFTRCAYAYHSVVSDEDAKASATVLREPLYHKGFPAVCFAGDATSDHYLYDAHGAVESGFREADRLIDLLHK